MCFCHKVQSSNLSDRKSKDDPNKQITIIQWGLDWRRVEVTGWKVLAIIQQDFLSWK